MCFFLLLEWFVIVILLAVASGDYMAKIAAQYNVALDALIAANPQVNDPALVQIGIILNPRFVLAKCLWA